MTRLSIYISATIMAVTLMTSCDSNPTQQDYSDLIVGKWQCNIEQSLEDGTVKGFAEDEYRSDGTVTGKGRVTLTMNDGSGTLELIGESHGSYQFEGGRLTETVISIEMEAGATSGAFVSYPQIAKQVIQSTKSEALGSTGTSIVLLLNESEMQAEDTSDGTKTTCYRVKEET